MRTLQIVKVIVIMVLVMVNIWFVASYLDVVIHNVNLDGGTVLHTWNFFKVCMN